MSVFDNPFDSFLAAVNLPAAPPASLGDAGPAAEASQPASAAFFSQMTETCPNAATVGQGKVAPAGASAGATMLTVSLSPAVALILSLITSAKPIAPDEAVSRGICLLAERIGIPSLARDVGEDQPARHANRNFEDLHDQPNFRRRAPNRFSARRDA